jgi:Arc/MetJ-type ribon-helix-helix transcriptional regulator
VTKLDEIAEYAQHHDFAAEMEQGTWEEDTASDPMVTTSVRLPKSLLDWVREQAESRHVRPSVLIRQWLEQQRDLEAHDDVADLATRVARLEGAVFTGTPAS